MTIRDKITFPENEKLKYELESNLIVSIRYSKLGSNLDIAKYLIENYGDINKEDLVGKTLLIRSLTMEQTYVDTNIIKFIILKGANVNKKVNALIEQTNKSGISNKLKTKINDLINDHEYEHCPLILAFENKYFDIIKLLLEKGADVNITDQSGNTLLMRSVYYGEVDAVRIILEFNPNLDVINEQNWSALYIAVEKHNIDIVKLLLDKGACMYKKDNSSSPFIRAMCSSLWENLYNVNNNDIVELFFENGAKIDILSNNGCDFLMDAISRKNLKIVKLLLENGVPINSNLSNTDDMTPLDFAFNKSRDDDCLEIIKFMIKKSGKYDKEKALKTTLKNNIKLFKIIKGEDSELLIEAIKSKNINMIKLLIKKGEANENIFFDIIKLNDMELMKLYCDNVKLSLKSDDILKIIINDNINLDILNFIYEKF